jgi:hypothetical protein
MRRVRRTRKTRRRASARNRGPRRYRDRSGLVPGEPLAPEPKVVARKGPDRCSCGTHDRPRCRIAVLGRRDHEVDEARAQEGSVVSADAPGSGWLPANSQPQANQINAAVRSSGGRHEREAPPIEQRHLPAASMTTGLLGRRRTFSCRGVTEPSPLAWRLPRAIQQPTTRRFAVSRREHGMARKVRAPGQAQSRRSRPRSFQAAASRRTL